MAGLQWIEDRAELIMSAPSIEREQVGMTCNTARLCTNLRWIAPQTMRLGCTASSLLQVSREGSAAEAMLTMRGQN